MTRPDLHFGQPSTVRTRAATSGKFPAGDVWLDGSTLVANAERYDEVVGGVQRRKPMGGWVDPTPYSLYVRHYSLDSGSMVSQGKETDGWTAYDGCVGASGPLNSLDTWNAALTEDSMGDESLFDQVYAQARSRMKQSQVNLGVAFGERKQTARLIGDTASRLAKTVVNLKRGRIRAAMNELGITHKRHQPRGQNWTQNWLELQYGWKPLLSDIHGACDALNGRNKGDWRVTVEATKKTEVDISARTSGSVAVLGGSSCRALGFYSVHVRVDLLPENEAKISLSSCGITNPLLIAWELVPFSFVVDWLLPVGEFIEGLDAMLGYNSATTCTSYFRKMRWDSSGISGQGSTVDSQIRNLFSGWKEVTMLDRSWFPGPPPVVLPRFKDPLSATHMANGLSLLAQAFGRTSRNFKVR
jgi:hypothetical protein